MEFRALEGRLPGLLNDHCTLFIFRLEKILGQEKNTIKIADAIQNETLKKMARFERKIPNFIYKRLISGLIVPRLEINDILYLHTKLV